MKAMKIINNLTIASVLTILVTPLAILVPHVSAAVDTCVWTGSGDGTSFSDGANWSTCDNGGVPENGDTLRFNMTNAVAYAFEPSAQLDNDIVGLSVAGIDLTGSSANYYGYTINGNSIDIAGDLTGDQTIGDLYLNVDISLSSSINYSVPNGDIKIGTFADAGFFDFNLGANNFTFNSTDDCANLNIFSRLIGSGNIISNTSSQGVNLRAQENGYTGDVIINGYGLAVSAGSLADSTTVTINNSGELRFADDTDYPFDVVMNSNADPALVASYDGFACSGGGGGPSQATTTLSGNLTLQRNTIFQGLPHNLNVTGTYTKNGHTLSVKTGSQGSITTSEGKLETAAKTTVIEKGDDSNAYLAVPNKETVVLNGSRGSVAVGPGGILKGTGSAESIYIDTNGTLAPGLSPGCITVNPGPLTLAGNYEVEIAGKTVCTEYDQTDVTGTVNVTGGTLNVSFLNSYIPALNDEFVIIKNDSSDAVTGTFTGMTNGSSFSVAGVTFQIKYDGGDGNDVTLTATAVPAAVTTPDTGISNLLNNPITMLMVTLLAGFTLVGIRKMNFRKAKS